MASANIVQNVARFSLGVLAAAGLLAGAALPAAAATPDQPAQSTATPVVHDHITKHLRKDERLLKVINLARTHPEQFPPRGNAQGAAMAACPTPLARSGALNGVARAHNEYLASQPIDVVNTFPNMHKDPNGKLVWDAGQPMHRAGYNSHRAEIVATGFATASEAVQFWMQDDERFGWGHRNQILNCANRDAGVSHHVGGPGGHYYTVDMGTR